MSLTTQLIIETKIQINKDRKNKNSSCKLIKSLMILKRILSKARNTHTIHLTLRKTIIQMMILRKTRIIQTLIIHQNLNL